MSSVALLKPKSWTGAMVDSVGGTDYIGTGGNLYYIKARRIVPGFDAPTKDLTGDGDASPCPEVTGFLEGQGLIDGWMIAAQSIGIIKLVTDSAYTTGSSYDPTFNVQVNYAKDSGSGSNPRNFSHDALMRRIVVSWRRRSPFVGVRFQYVKNGALTEGAAAAGNIATHTLAKPASHTTAVLTGGAVSTTGDKLYIKVHHAIFDFSTRIEPVTGDGDTDPKYEASMFLDGSVRFNGYVPSGQNIGIGNMINADGTNPVRTVTFALANSDTIAMSGVIDQVRTSLVKDQGFVGISARLTKTTSDGTETLVEA